MDSESQAGHVPLHSRVEELEKQADATRTELDAIYKEVDKLPGTPPGFSSTRIDKVKWTRLWVKEHWADAIALAESKRERSTAQADLMLAQRDLVCMRLELANARSRIEEIVKAVGL